MRQILGLTILATLISSGSATQGLAGTTIKVEGDRVPAHPEYGQRASIDLSAEFSTTGVWRAVVTAALDPKREFVSEGEPSKSSICFIRDSTDGGECTYFRDLFSSRLTFQVLKDLSVVELISGRTETKGLRLEASALYPTGQTPEVAIWIYDRRQEKFSVAARLTSKEVRIFPTGVLKGCLVTADWFWQVDKGETRFGSDHQRVMTLYRYRTDKSAGTYQKILTYVTEKKYDPEDLDTIEAERAHIEARLRAAEGNGS